jgi:hypothetical protein
VRILLSCVSENDPAWTGRVENLVRSVRWFGGSLSEAPFVANFVDGVAPQVENALGDLGAEVRVVKSVNSRFRHGNKLRMLELCAEGEFDVLVGLDCDTVVVDDFARLVAPASIGAKPVEQDFFTDREWQRLYAVAGLRPPPKSLRTTSSGEPVAPYFNTGVLTVPRALCAELHRLWGDWHSRLAALNDRAPVAGLDIYMDQAALAIAIEQGGMPWVAIPVAMNLPCHMPVHPGALASGPPPAILHYHDRVHPQGFLELPVSDAAAPAADRFNRRLAEHLSLAYGGLSKRPARVRLRRAARGRLRRAWRRRFRLRPRTSGRLEPRATGSSGGPGDPAP